MRADGIIQYGILRAIYDSSIDIDTNELGLLNVKIDTSLDVGQLILNREYVFICIANYERYSGHRYNLVIKDIMK